MYLVKLERYGATYLIFTWADPRSDGFKGDVLPDVELDYDPERVHSWPDGHERPEVVVGRDPRNPKCYKIFKYGRDLQAAGYERVPGTVFVFGSWAEPALLRMLPPDPEETKEERWYEYFDRVDRVSRQHRDLKVEDRPAGNDRDQVAAWVARKHLVADSSIREVWYLPEGSPPQDIRLLEVNERFAGGSGQVQAIDFGLDIDGARFRLYVADVNTEELEQIKRDPALLPRGWVIENPRISRRG